MTKTTSLNNLEINQTGIIKDLKCNDHIRRRLLDLGMVKGTSIVPVLKNPSGDPIAYEVRGSIIALRSEDSSLIEVILSI